MAQPYTDQEIQDAVERIVRSAIRRPIGSLGIRDVGVVFDDFQEAASAVLTATPTAPFYVVRLGCGRLTDKVLTLAVVCNDIDEAAQALGRPDRPVDSIASLANARVAAEAMALAGTGRTSQFIDVEKLPAFQRLDRNVQRFLDDYSAPNIRRGGQLVRSRQEGRAVLPGTIRSLKEQRADVIAAVMALADSIQDYEALNLPHLLSSGVVERASQVIAERQQQLEALSAADRAAVIRAVTLDLIAARSLIRKFSSLSAPTLFLRSDGTGGVYADQTHPAAPASLTVTLPGNYGVRVDSVAINNQLDFLIDGTVRRAVTTGGSYLAGLTGLVPDTYEIVAAVNDTVTVSFVELGAVTPVVVTLTAGAARTAQDICDDINAVMTQPIEAVVALTPRKYQGRVDIAGVDPAAVTFTFPAFTLSDWVAMGIREGDKVKVLEGANAGSTYQINIGGVGAATLTCTRLTGAATTTQANQMIELGGPGSTVRIKITDAYAATALANRSAVRVGVAGDTVEVPTCATLGLTAGVTTASRPLPAQTVVDSINSATTTALSGLSRLNATVTTAPLYSDVGVHTESSRPTIAFIYRYRGRGDCTVGGTVATFVLPGVMAVPGDEFVIRATSVAADMNRRGTITSVVSDTVVVTFGSAVTAATDVLVDVAPDLTSLPPDTVVSIPSGINTGQYRVLSQGAVIKSELTLAVAWTTAQQFSGQPIEMVGDIVQEFLTVSSTTTDLTTAVQLDDGSPVNPYSAAYLFATTRPLSSVGTTAWFRFEAMPGELQVGDTIELHLTGYNIVDYVVTVTSIEQDGVVGIDPPLPTTTPAVPFIATATFPFGRIRRIRRDNFDVFEAAARQWLARAPLQDRWLTELDRAVTTVLSEPTPAAIHDLRAHVNELTGILTVAGATALSMPTANTIEEIAQAYQADVVGEVDTLVQSLLQQGADRAVDILLEGRFSQYFGFTMDQASYAGNVLALTRQVMQQDLPVRAVRRRELQQRQVSLGSFEEPDYEYDQQDIDTGLVPDAPGQNPPPRQGDAY